MPYRNLADFLEDLGRAGELAPVDAEVDPCLEIAEITRRVARHDGPALLFRNVKGHDIPLLTNLLGSESRILRALGADSLDEATARIDRTLNSGGNEGWLERLRFGGKSGASASFAPNRVKTGACQQVVQIGSDIDLEELPLLQYTKVNGGLICQDDATTAPPWVPTLITPIIHSAVILSAEPETHQQVSLRGDVLVAGRDTAVLAWSDVANPSRLAKLYQEHGGKMPVAIVIGGDPVLQLAAAAPLPAPVDLLSLAGLLREKPLDSVACRSVDLNIPAEADFVIEGFIESIGEKANARMSSFGRLFFSSGCRDSFRATAVSCRANRVFPEIVPLVFGNELAIRERFVAKLFLPHLRLRIPELIDFDLPLSGNARHIAILSIDKTYKGQARQVATAAWSMRPFDNARLLVLVDSEVDVRDAEQVLSAIAAEVNWKDDVWSLDAPPDPLDPTSSWGRPVRRVAIDAMRAFRGEGGSPDAKHVKPDHSILELVTNRWSEYGLGPEADQ